jgi:hypothetical protein
MPLMELFMDVVEEIPILRVFGGRGEFGGKSVAVVLIEIRIFQFQTCQTPVTRE